MASTNRFKAEQTRDYLRKRGFKPEFIIPYCYRPFDLRWVYWEPETKLLDEKRCDYVPTVAAGSLWLQSRQKGERQAEGSPFFVTRAAADHHLTRPGCACFPLLATERNLLTDHKGEAANLTHLAQSYAANRGPADSVWFHALAIGHSRRYLTENSGALWQDWPRIPLPASAAVLQASAALGRQVASLLDIEQPVPGVNISPIRSELRVIGVLTAASGQLDPGAGDLDLTAGWGHGGKGGVTMPGKGKAVARPDHTAYDVYLNGKAFWSNIPSGVWEYTLGGYQVIKKWLSYREKALLGRGLTKEEARHVTDMARRIAALLLLGPALDANYETVKREAAHFANKK